MSKLIGSLTEEIERICEILLEDRELNTNRLLAFKKGLECILERCKSIQEENDRNQGERGDQANG